MSLPSFTHVAPASLAEALGILEDGDAEARVIGGGTDLVPAMRFGLSRPKTLVSLARVADLTEIAVDTSGTLHIGGSVRLRALVASSVVAGHSPLLQQAARAVGSPQLREMGTVAGNVLLEPRCCFYNRSAFWRSCRPICLKSGGDICNAVGSRTKCYAVFSGDLAPALISLRAEVVVATSAGEHTLRLSDLYTGDGVRPLSLGRGHILREVLVERAAPGTIGVYLKRRSRGSIDFPLVSCALVRSPGAAAIPETRVVLGAVASRPLQIEGVEEALASAGPEDAPRNRSGVVRALASLACRQAKPVENVLGVSASWRRSAVRELVAAAWDELDRRPGCDGERSPA